MAATKLYAQALFEASQKEGANAKTLVKNLARHLEADGRVKLLPAILRDLQRLDAAQAKLAPTVEVAHAHESAAALKSAKQYGIHAEHASVNPALIKGWRATDNGKLIDHSAKRELIDLYRSITASSV